MSMSKSDIAHNVLMEYIDGLNLTDDQIIRITELVDVIYDEAEGL